MKFEKYHGTGNDFILLFEEPNNKEEIIKKLCHPKFGIGADGLMYPSKQGNNYYMNYFNQDGSRAPMCGNGIRCFSKFLELNYNITFPISIYTDAGIKVIEKENNHYRVNLSKPDEKVTTSLHYKEVSYNTLNKMIINKKEIEYYIINLSTIHVVIFDNINIKYAEEISNKTNLFPKKTNVNFVEIINNKEIYVKTFERGVGWTYSCGTGVASSAYISNKVKNLNNNLIVNIPGGILTVEINDDNEVILTGEATKVFEGNINI